MKLRNKKTGEIVELSIYGIEVHIRKEEQPFYHSIAELNEQWEDVEPAEPLIKDEKVRKAVRAWANSFDDVDEIKASDDYKDFWIDGYLIEFERSFNEEERGHTYRRTNIAELCGEATDEA